MQCFQLVKTVLDELYSRIPAENGVEKDGLIRQKLTELAGSYANLARGNSVNHADIASRFAYIYRYVTSHANIVFQIISDSDELGILFDQSKVNITCIGGGPGSEFLGVLKYVLKTGKKPSLRCTLYDKETAWGECWNDVGEELEAELRIHTFCQAVDVTEAKTWQDMSKYLSSDLFTMVYFLSEIDSVREKAEPFFLNLFEKSKPSALFLYVDNNNAGFYGWFDEMVSRFPIDVLSSRQLRMPILDNSEEKTDLGEYWEKFDHPKLRGDIAFRVCRKRIAV